MEICDTKDDRNPKIITLENCVKITQEPCPANLIYIVKKTGTLTLNALNEDSLKEWVNALQTVAFRSKNETILLQSAIEEDNDLYCSSYGDGLFIVTLIPSEASMRCNIDSKVYMLHLTATELQLKTTNDLTSIVSKWPYRFIRKYGYRNGKFTFEAGRKCATGEGIFTLDHTNPQEVFRCMSSKMKSMKKMISGDSVTIDNSENQLHIAACMEPGSRSPLPPSPSGQNSTEFEISQTQSNMSARVLFPTSDSLSNSSFAFVVSPKMIPNKPPRKINAVERSTPTPLQIISSKKQSNGEKIVMYNKIEPVTITSSSDPNKAAGSLVILNPPSPDMYNKHQDHENTLPELPARNEIKYERDYESIETITDAWKTLGINEVKHHEHISTDLNNIIWARTNCKNLPTPKIIDIDIGEGIKSHKNNKNTDCTYDRLDFLSANHKTSSGYKTIVTVAPLPTQDVVQKSTQNDYELINVADTEAIFKLDENSLNHNTQHQSSIFSSSLKQCKDPRLSNNTASNNSHEPGIMRNPTDQIFLDDKNEIGLNYAVVSKAKRI